MASLMVRNIPEDAKLRFRQIAAAHGRSMEEHLRQMIIEADLGGGDQRPTYVAEARQTFTHAPRHEQVSTKEDVVRELIRIADGAGEGAFDTGKYAAIRFMTAKDAMAELRRLANGVGLDLPPRMNTKLEAPDF
jgi:plasmid stability protein